MRKLHLLNTWGSTLAKTRGPGGARSPSASASCELQKISLLSASFSKSLLHQMEEIAVGEMYNLKPMVSVCAELNATKEIWGMRPEFEHHKTNKSTILRWNSACKKKSEIIYYCTELSTPPAHGCSACHCCSSYSRRKISVFCISDQKKITYQVPVFVCGTKKL